MNEGVKTLLFVGVAVLVAVIAVASQPRPPAADPQVHAGKLLNEVDDPLTANYLKIVKFDEGTSAIREFEVAQEDGQWVIPSQEDYPADAEQQMAQAATSVMNLDIFGIASTNAGTHATYGVVDPDPDQIEVGSQGVGTRVTMKNQAGDDLVEMIIGKEVKDAEGQRYVRHVGKDAVYIVKLDPSKLLTDFSEWIEKDLLKLNPFDIKGLQLNDYSVEQQFTLQGARLLEKRRSEISLDYNDGDSKWVLEKLVQFDPKTNKPIESGLPEGEELDQTKLNDLKTALDDLKIVDVERKPEVITENFDAIVEMLAKLQAGGEPNRDDPGMAAMQNLLERGFVVADVKEDDELEFLSSEGEVIAQMKDGVEYVLRFGKIVLGPGEEKPDADGEKDSGINRYVFVSTRFNKELLDKPELQDVPQASAKEEEESDSKADDAKADEGGAKSQATESDEAASEGDEDDAEDDAPSEASEGADDKSESDATDDAGEVDAVEEDAKPSPEELEKERAQIEKANRRKLDQYEARIDAGKKRVDELNERFGDWYYVISDSVYKKIHLGLDDILQKKEKTDEEQKDGDATEEATTPE